MTDTPASIRELADHCANLIYILDFHEKLGTTKSALITQELSRANAALEEVIKSENSQGGAFYKAPKKETKS